MKEIFKNVSIPYKRTTLSIEMGRFNLSQVQIYKIHLTVFYQIYKVVPVVLECLK